MEGSISHTARAAHEPYHSPVPTRYLDGAATLHSRRQSGLSGALPRVPRTTDMLPPLDDAAALSTHRATHRRRRLLAIFGRMMARFYDRHERRWSMGRWACSLCQRRIVAWAWLPDVLTAEPAALHEECISRSMWEMVLYHEWFARHPQPPIGTALPWTG